MIQQVKSDWGIIKEAERQGLMVSMTGLVERVRTDLNNELMAYFRGKLPKYEGVFDENKGEDILYNINEYIENKGIDKRPIDFPFGSDTDLYLIPITENLQLKLTVADEYEGDGEYSKYVMADFFLITEQATQQDVDTLIEFINENLK